MKKITIPMVILMIGVLGLFETAAAVRVIVRPYWPRAVVVVPPPRPAVVPPRRRPPAYPAGAGFVNLQVTPEDAYVYVDGSYRGIAGNFSYTPQNLPVTGGKHTLLLEREGYTSQSFALHIIPGQVLDLDVNLAPINSETQKSEEPATAHELDLDQTGYLLLNVDPPDASVYIDGEFYGVASQFSELQGALVLAPGAHHLEIVKPGFSLFTREIDIKDGQKQTIGVSLPKTK